MIHANKVHKMIHQRAVMKAECAGPSRSTNAKEHEAYNMSSVAKIISHECKTMIQYIFHKGRGKSVS